MCFSAFDEQIGDQLEGMAALLAPPLPVWALVPLLLPPRPVAVPPPPAAPVADPDPEDEEVEDDEEEEI